METRSLWGRYERWCVWNDFFCEKIIPYTPSFTHITTHLQVARLQYTCPEYIDLLHCSWLAVMQRQTACLCYFFIKEVLRCELLTTATQNMPPCCVPCMPGSSSLKAILPAYCTDYSSSLMISAKWKIRDLLLWHL